MDLMRAGRIRLRRLAAVASVAGVIALTGTLFARDMRASATSASAAGEEVYAAQKCSACHSIEGKGNKKYPLDGVGSRLSEADIREWLVNPDVQQAKKTSARPLMRMPSYRSLPPEDVDVLVGYLKSLK
jgi:mono/diheme cytochrome c family protein